MDIADFYNKHQGETCLLVGNGENLHATPPTWFDYPSIGMNTIHKYQGWQPTYYVTADHRVYREFGEEIKEKYADIPKFIPYPDLDVWKGINFVRWYHKSSAMGLNDYATEGIAYLNVMHIAMQLAWYMGAKIILMIGVEHAPHNPRAHFWGEDVGIKDITPLADWLKAYKFLSDELAAQGVKILNLSPDTYVPADVLLRGSWEDWIKN